MMKKKVTYTNVTPIPSYIPRQLAIDILHSHGEILTLNPLVLNYNAVKAPRDAPADEFYSTWYEIEQRIQFVPGTGKMGSGKIKFKGCFHDLPWGLQTHIYAPMNVDMRNKWRIAGNQPGEPREPVEMGIGAPPDGLYLREDVEIKANITMVSFVKKEMKAASKILVDRLIKKAELIDAGELQAMMENGRLRTINPADRSTAGRYDPGRYEPSSGNNSPRAQSIRSAEHKPHPFNPPPSQSQTGGVPYTPGSLYAHHQSQSQSIAMELPGDYYHPAPPPPPSSDTKPHAAAPPPLHLHPSNQPRPHSVAVSELTAPRSPPPPGYQGSGRWSNTISEYQSTAGSRPTSYTGTDAGSVGGMRSPRFEQGSFGSVQEEQAAEMDAGNQNHANALKILEGQQGQSQNQNQTQGVGLGLQQPQPQSPDFGVKRYNPRDWQ